MKVSKIITAASLALVALATQTLHAAPVAWGANGHQYDLVSVDRITWSAAAAATSAMGGGWHLATITSLAEQQFLEANVLPAPSGADHYWVGATDVQSEGSWQWVTNEAFSYANWNVNEPNGGPAEDFLAVDARGNWKWNDVPDSIEQVYGGLFARGYLIERNPVPEPGSIALAGLGLLGLAAARRARKG